MSKISWNPDKSNNAPNQLLLNNINILWKYIEIINIYYDREIGKEKCFKIDNNVKYYICDIKYILRIVILFITIKDSILYDGEIWNGSSDTSLNDASFNYDNNEMKLINIIYNSNNKNIILNNNLF